MTPKRTGYYWWRLGVNDDWEPVFIRYVGLPGWTNLVQRLICNQTWSLDENVGHYHSRIEAPNEEPAR